MAKLCQIIAVAAGKKAAVEKAKTLVYHDIQKPVLFEGIAKTYQTAVEDGDKFPDEKKIVQRRVKDCVKDFRAALVELFDCILTQETANTDAKADVVVTGGDGKSVTLLAGVPVVYLLFLEKQLAELGTFISKLPTLDPAHEWEYDDKADSWATKPVQTVKTKKVPTAFKLYDATDKHPAQVERVDVDVLIGNWTTITYSGAIKGSDKNAMMERLKSLIEAVKFARTSANAIDTQYKHAKPVLDFVFGTI